MLIKLTGIPHPDVNGGQSWPIYIDATRVLFITRSIHRPVKMMNSNLKAELYDDLYDSTRRLHEHLQKVWPTEIDNQEAAAWAKTMTMASQAVNEAYSQWNRSYRADEFWAPVECTEIQLACGTALEHGVMLARMWCMEQPDEVAKTIHDATDGRARASYKE